jgi:hypothetical protein
MIVLNKWFSNASSREFFRAVGFHKKTTLITMDSWLNNDYA